MDTTLVAAWQNLCQQLRPAFTAPTFVTFLHIVTSWVLCRSRPTVTNLICTIGTRLLGHPAKHWTAYEQFFYRSVWNLQVVSEWLLRKVVLPLVEVYGLDQYLDIGVDDTTCGRWGKHVAFAGYFKDASASNTKAKVVHWSHNWLIGAVLLRSKRWPNWVILLPVWFDLYRKRPDCNRPRPFATRSQMAAAMLRQIRNLVPDWRVRVAVDGQYATGEMAKAVRSIESNLVSRIRSDAAIYALPPQPKPGQRGPRRKKGQRLPSPQQMAARRKKGWRLVAARMYGKRQQRLVLSIVCLWYRVAGRQPIKLLIVRDPEGQQKDEYLFCTDTTVSEVEILERFAGRWPVEESIEDGKQLDGMEKVQGWCQRTVLRQAPLALVIQTLVKAWYLQYGIQAKSVQPKGADWQRCKEHPSYLDMLATLRRVLWTERIMSNSTFKGRVRGFWKTLQFALTAAA